MHLLRNREIRIQLIISAAVTLAVSAVMAIAYARWGRSLIGLMPHGSDYAAYAGYMPWLVVITAATTCQVFYTNAEVSAGRYGFLWWLVPLHIVYPAALWMAVSHGMVVDMWTMLVWFGAASFARFLFAAIGWCRVNPRVVQTL